MKIKEYLRKSLVFMSLAMILVIGNLSCVVVQASETKPWYLYYNDYYTNQTAYTCTFGNYIKRSYNAQHTSRSSTSVTAKISATPYTGTQIGASVYTVASQPVLVYVSGSDGSQVYLTVKFGYYVAPAHSYGTISHS